MLELFIPLKQDVLEKMTVKGVHTYKTTKQRQAEEHDRQIQALTRLRNELDPSYEPYVKPDKPQSRISRFISRIDFLFDITASYAMLAFMGLIGGTVLCAIICALLERLFGGNVPQ